MAGSVQAWLSDGDLARLVSWAECSSLGCDWTLEDGRLADRLRRYLDAVACTPCQGGACQVPQPGAEESPAEPEPAFDNEGYHGFEEPVPLLDCIGDSCGRPTL